MTSVGEQDTADGGSGRISRAVQASRFRLVQASESLVYNKRQRRGRQARWLTNRQRAALQTGLDAADEVQTGWCVGETAAIIGETPSSHPMKGKVTKNHSGRGHTEDGQRLPTRWLGAGAFQNGNVLPTARTLSSAFPHSALAF